MKTVAISAPAELAVLCPILEKRFADRGILSDANGYRIMLALCPSLPTDAFALRPTENGVTVASSTVIGVLNGAGYFLRGSAFTETGFLPCAFRGIRVPECAFRSIYLAHHFHNFYHNASVEELGAYLEDMALWGMNNVHLGMGIIDMDSTDDPAFDAEADQISAVFRYAKRIGYSVSTGVSVGQVTQKYPKEFTFTPVYDPQIRHGNSGNILCMSVPGAQEYVDDLNRKILNAYKARGVTVDFVRAWPYDEGGCGCEKCAPNRNWGGVGYVRAAKSAFAAARSVFPKVGRILSTWTFDTPECGEWASLSASLAEEKWCDIILADSHGDFPRYPLENGVPGNLPMISFPEISMWGLYPWGGWGANPLPQRFTRLWRQTKHHLAGESLYSEGIYEDLNKCVIANLTWDYAADDTETLGEYARYEFGLNAPEKFIEMVRLIEKTHTEVAERGRCSLADADAAFRLAQEVDGVLPEWGKKCWRWRILYLRALIDSRRYRLADAAWGEKTSWSADEAYRPLLDDDAPVQAAFRELIALFHCEEVYSGDPYHVRVRPVTR